MCKGLKKFTEANTRKMDKKFACKNRNFDFHAGQLSSGFKNPAVGRPRMLLKSHMLHSYFNASIKLESSLGTTKIIVGSHLKKIPKVRRDI